MVMAHAPLPQLDGGLFLSDGGLETTLIFLEGVALPHFAAFVLLRNDSGRDRLRAYYRPYLERRQPRPMPGLSWRRQLGARARTGADCSATTNTRSRKPTWKPHGWSATFAMNGGRVCRGPWYSAESSVRAAMATSPMRRAAWPTQRTTTDRKPPP